MTCAKCETKVKSALLKLPYVTAVQISKEEESAKITMDQHVSLKELEQAVSAVGNYMITEGQQESIYHKKTFWITYKPLLLIMSYISLFSILIPIAQGQYNLMLLMQYFMAGFFITFSFFKLLDLKGFASSYQMYDILAMKIPVWAFIYPFVELFLGIAYAVNFNPVLTNAVTLIVMILSIAGVIRAVTNKRVIKCACLGTVFNLPMTTVTIVEDGLMILMSAAMLIII